MAASARVSVGALAALVAGYLEEVETAAGVKLTVLHEGEPDPTEGAFVRFSLGVEFHKRQRGTDEADKGTVLVRGLLVVGTEQPSPGAIYTLIDRCQEKLRERTGVDANGNQIDLGQPSFDPPATVPLDEERSLVAAEFEIAGTCRRSSGTSYTDFMA